MERNWNGILIEPIPSFYQEILSKNRNIYSINACIAQNKPIIAKFRLYSVLSGRLKTMTDEHQKRIDKESESKNKISLFIPCFSINTILAAINVNKVDYFSLDVEGGELDVLKSINYSKIQIDTFSVEHNNVVDEKNRIKSFMEKNGFKTQKDAPQDIYFVRN